MMLSHLLHSCVSHYIYNTKFNELLIKTELSFLFIRIKSVRFQKFLHLRRVICRSIFIIANQNHLFHASAFDPQRRRRVIVWTIFFAFFISQMTKLLHRHQIYAILTVLHIPHYYSINFIKLVFVPHSQ